MQGAPIVPERPDGRMKPGELQSGGYGFYYKGQQAVTPQPTKDVLQDLQVSLPEPEVQVRPRPQEPANPYQEVITSNVYFTNEKWQEVLASHGIVVDAETKTLTIQSSGVKRARLFQLMLLSNATAQNNVATIRTWAQTPPMGWNSWDYYSMDADFYDSRWR